MSLKVSKMSNNAKCYFKNVVIESETIFKIVADNNKFKNGRKRAKKYEPLLRLGIVIQQIRFNLRHSRHQFFFNPASRSSKQTPSVRGIL